MSERMVASAARFALSIDGAHAAWLLAVHGGDAVGEVVEVADGSDPVIRKHIGAVRYSDIELEVGSDANATVFGWIRDALDGRLSRKHGAVTAIDANFAELWRIEFSNAALSELTIPPLDASAKTTVHLGLRLSPELARRHAGSGQKAASSARGLKTKAPKAWTASNFRLSLDGLQTSRVVTIDPLVVRTSVPQDQPGERRVLAGPPSVRVGNLVATLADVNDTSWWEWHDDFLINGNNGTDRERSGTLELAGPDGTSQLQFALHGVGLVSLGTVRRAATTDATALRAELYCERVALATS